MNNPQGQGFYDGLIKRNLIPKSVTYDKFNATMQNDAKRQQMFDKLKAQGVLKKDKDYNAFSGLFINNVNSDKLKQAGHIHSAQALEKADEYEGGFWKGVGDMIESGAKSQFVGTVLKGPQYVQDVLATGIRKAGDLLGFEEAADKFADAQAGTLTGIQSSILANSDLAQQWEADAAALSQGVRKEFGEKDSWDLLKEGNIADAAKSTAFDIAGSIPGIAGTIINGPLGLASMGLSAASNKSDQLQKEGFGKEVSVLNGAVTGLAEIIFEKIGLDNVTKPAIEMIKKAGKKKFTEETARTIGKRIANITGRAGVEGSAEFATQFTENLTDILTGVKVPTSRQEVEDMLLDGTGSAFMAGAGMGAGMTVAGEVTDKVFNKKDKGESDEQTFIDNSGKPIVIKGKEVIESFRDFVKKNPGQFKEDETQAIDSQAEGQEAQQPTDEEDVQTAIGRDPEDDSLIKEGWDEEGIIEDEEAPEETPKTKDRWDISDKIAESEAKKKAEIVPEDAETVPEDAETVPIKEESVIKPIDEDKQGATGKDIINPGDTSGEGKIETKKGEKEEKEELPWKVITRKEKKRTLTPESKEFDRIYIDKFNRGKETIEDRVTSILGFMHRGFDSDNFESEITKEFSKLNWKTKKGGKGSTIDALAENIAEEWQGSEVDHTDIKDIIMRKLLMANSAKELRQQYIDDYNKNKEDKEWKEDIDREPTLEDFKDNEKEFNEYLDYISRGVSFDDNIPDDVTFVHWVSVGKTMPTSEIDRIIETEEIDDEFLEKNGRFIRNVYGEDLYNQLREQNGKEKTKPTDNKPGEAKIIQTNEGQGENGQDIREEGITPTKEKVDGNKNEAVPDNKGGRTERDSPEQREKSERIAKAQERYNAARKRLEEKKRELGKKITQDNRDLFGEKKSDSGLFGDQDLDSDGQAAIKPYVDAVKEAERDLQTEKDRTVDVSTGDMFDAPKEDNSAETKELVSEGENSIPKTVRDLANLDAERQSGLLSGAVFSNLSKDQTFKVGDRTYTVTTVGKPIRKKYDHGKNVGEYTSTLYRIKDENGLNYSYDIWDNWTRNGNKMLPMIAGRGQSKNSDKFGYLSRAIEGDITVDLINENNSFHEKSDSYNIIQAYLDGIDRTPNHTEKTNNPVKKNDSNVPFTLDGNDKFYHATGGNFDGKLKPSNAPQFGIAIYLSTDKDKVQKEFGEKVYEVNLSITNPVYTNTEGWYKVQTEAIKLADADYGKRNNITMPDGDDYFHYDYNNLSEADEIPSKFISDAAKKMGYDAIIDRGSNQYGNEIAVLYEDKIIYPKETQNGNNPLGATPTEADIVKDPILRRINQAFLAIGSVIMDNATDLKKKAQELTRGSDKNSLRYNIIGENGAANLENATKVLEDLALANKMEKEGYKPKLIHFATSWEKGIDGKWRFELPYLKLKDNAEGKIRKDGLKYLEGIVDATELFQAYPKLKKVGVYYDNTTDIASYNPVSGIIYINLDNIPADTDLRSIVIHETQHAIQFMEGFSEGASTSYYESSPGKSKEDTPFKRYERTAGEVEARNAEKRSKFSSRSKVSETLRNSEDISRKDQLVLYHAIDENRIYKKESPSFHYAPNGEILGFTHEGKIYLNGQKITANTTMEEAGHIWINWAKESRQDLYKQGIGKVDRSSYLLDVMENADYIKEALKQGPQGSQAYNDYLREEALAKAIADQGAKFVTETRRNEFKAWARNLWREVAKNFGIKNLSPNKINGLTLEEFAKMAAADIFSKNNTDGTVLAGNLESDSGKSTDKNGMVPKDVQGSTRQDRPNDGARQTQPKLQEDIPPVSGERGNNELPGNQGQNNDTVPGERGGGTNLDNGGQADSNRETGTTKKGVDDGVVELFKLPKFVRKDHPHWDFDKKRGLQAKANNLPVKPKDIQNISDTLPFLLNPQIGDVYKAEKRFETDNGIMFTNATGTGKTYTGLGIAKRFYNQGKKNILIVAPGDKSKEWTEDAENLDFPLKVLDDTKDDGGDMPCSCTYQNFYANDKLKNRVWDLIIYDESHKLMSNQDGDETKASQKHRFLAGSYSGSKVRAKDFYKDEIRKYNDDRKKLSEKADREYDSSYWKQDNATEKARLDSFKEQLDKKIEEKAKEYEGKTKVVFLSATPFQYVTNLKYADGFLFKANEQEDPKKEDRYNRYKPSSQWDEFLIDNFGYFMKSGRLNQPDAAVDSDILERDFTDKLINIGALSTRKKDIREDFSRDFVTIESKAAEDVNEGLKFISDSRNNYPLLSKLVKTNFLFNMQFLEAVKADRYIDQIKAHLTAGRKVVLFHNYNVGISGNPFDFTGYLPGATNELRSEIFRLQKQRPDLLKLPFDNIKPPVQRLTEEFGDRLTVFNGKTKSTRSQGLKQFNKDNSGVDLILIQVDAGKEGLSLHDKTGGHQRVLINLGIPNKPSSWDQIEGRIYRTGQKSPAIFEYPTFGLEFEKNIIAGVISSRAGTVENLAYGNLGRSLKTIISETYADATDAPKNQGAGGKESDASIESATEWERAKTFYYKKKKRNQQDKSWEGNDYFATPEPIGMKMAEWLQLGKGEKGLEPSAGDGAIARFFPQNSINTFIEPSYELAAKLGMNVGSDPIKQMPFEDFNRVNKFDGIAMNPPFGSGGKTAMEHIDKAFNEHLRYGGRLVALIPNGPSMQKRLDQWMEHENQKDAHLIAEVILPSSTFARAGTTVNTKIIVIDKSPQPKYTGVMNMDYSYIENINDLFDEIEDRSMPSRMSAEKPDKGDMFKASKSTLGFAVGNNGITMDLSKLSPLKKLLLKAVTKYFEKERGIGQVFYSMILSRDNGFNALIHRMKNNVKRFQRSATGATIENIKIYNDYLKATDKDKFLEDNPIGEKILEILQDMRTDIDNLSLQLYHSGIVNTKELGTTIAENLGVYMTRSYRIHNDEKWAKNIPPDIIERAEEWVRNEIILKNPDLFSNVDPEAKSIALVQAMINNRGLSGLGSGNTGTLGTVMQSVLKKRQDLPKEIRDLFGEYNDPVVNYASSIHKMAWMLENYKMVKNMESWGLQSGLFSLEPEGENTHMLGDDGKSSVRVNVPSEKEVRGTEETIFGETTVFEMAEEFETKFANIAGFEQGLLSKYYTNKDMKDAFHNWKTFQAKDAFWTTVMRYNGYIKKGKTVYYPQSHLRNVISNFNLMVMNWDDFYGGIKHVKTAFFDNNGKTITIDGRTIDRAQYYESLIRAGVLHDTPHMGELNDIIKTFDSGTVATKFDTFQDNWFKRSAKATGAKLDFLYRAEDDFFKLVRFETEKKRYAKAWYGKSASELNAKEYDRVFKKAASIVGDTMPTYSRVPLAVKRLKNSPIFSSFPSFAWEVMRIQGNVIRLAREDMKDPATRGIGYTRLFGLAASYASTYATAAMLRGLFGAYDDEEDYVDTVVAPWNKDHQTVQWLMGDGTMRMIDLGQMDALAVYKNPFEALTNKQVDVEQRFINAIMMLVKPFVDLEIGIKLGIELSSNNDSKGDPIYSEYNLVLAMAQILNHTAKVAQPGFMTQATRLLQGATSDKKDLMTEIVASFGLRVSEVKIPTSIYFNSKALGATIRDIKYSDKLAKKTENPLVEIAEWATQEKEFEKMVKSVKTNYNAGIHFGLTKKEVLQTMVKGGIPMQILNKVIRGETITLNEYRGDKK